MGADYWYTSDDPVAMLQTLGLPSRDGSPPRISERKVRLFALAKYRMFHQDVNPGVRQVLDWIDDGLKEETRPQDGWHVMHRDLEYAALFFIRTPTETEAKLLPAVAHALRDIVNYPFRQSCLCGRAEVYLRPGEALWLSRRCEGCRDVRTGTVLNLAREAYSQARPPHVCPECLGRMERGVRVPCHVCRRSGAVDDGALYEDRLCVLGDALFDAGLPDGNPALEHLRSPGPHYRGMWSLDLVLGLD